MRVTVFLVGLAALLLAITDTVFQLHMPVGIVYSPFFWIVYVLVLTITATIKFVRQQEVFVVERLGKYNRTLSAGINFVVPVVERLAFQFDLRERVIDVPEQDAITKDNATVTIDGILYFKILDAKDSAYGAKNIEQAVINLAQTTMRSAIGSMELDKTFENREEINKKVVAAVSEAGKTWGVQVTRYEIKDIKMPQSLLESMERQMKAEREKRAAILESEGVRQAKINHAEGEKQSAILVAEGQQQSAVLVAKGQAEAISLVAKEINENGGDKAVQLEVAKKTLEQFGNLAKKNNSLVLMGESADPVGWLTKAMAVIKTIDNSKSVAQSTSSAPSK
ncbi:MAG: SPFH/Band 7/PHB domain protein [Parcubacteria group bacterium]|nr:SPFH/Band 7/PHB domain protein [Parcubacteria group bacterium]